MDNILRAGIVRKSNSKSVAFVNEQSDDLFSGALFWLVQRPLRVFGLVLVCFLCLSIACNQVGSADSAAPEAGVAIVDQNNPDTPEIDAAIESHAGALIDADNASIFAKLFPDGRKLDDEQVKWLEQIVTLAFRLTLAAVLGAVVAFRPRRFFQFRQQKSYVMQTQILLTVVACALMMIVGDNAARAFGIFAAASLVRFRTKIRDPKQVTILLINLGIGLAVGVGRWELATLFALFVLLLLRIMEAYESNQEVRTIKFSVKTIDVEATDGAIRGLFERNSIEVSTTAFSKANEKRPLGKVVYSVGTGTSLDTKRLAEEIYLADPINIDQIEWHHKKTSACA
jgi:uncharacterized membrane protein YhiD involved in acid resistance